MPNLAPVFFDQFADFFDQPVIARNHADRCPKDQVMTRLDALAVKEHARFVEDCAVFVVEPERCLLPDPVEMGLSTGSALGTGPDFLGVAAGFFGCGEISATGVTGSDAGPAARFWLIWAIKSFLFFILG